MPRRNDDENVCESCGEPCEAYVCLGCARLARAVAETEDEAIATSDGLDATMRGAA